MKYLGKKSLIASIVLISSSAFADYQVEVMGAYNTIEIEDLDFTTTAVAANYYLEKVVTDNIVLSEAAFLNKSSSVGIMYSKAEVENFDSSAFGVHGRFLLQNPGDYTVQGFIVSSEYSDDFGVSVGKYLDESTEVSVGIESSDLFDDTIFARYKTIGQLNQTNIIGFDGGVGITDGDLEVDFGGDYFIDRSNSIGGRIGMGFYDETITSLAINFESFLNPQFAIDGSVVVPDLGESYVGFQIGFTGRF